jgi:hypothetical protein
MTIIKIRFDTYASRAHFFDKLTKNIDKIDKIKCKKLYRKDCKLQVKLYFTIPFNEAYNLTIDTLRTAIDYSTSAFDFKIVKKGK